MNFFSKLNSYEKDIKHINKTVFKVVYPCTKKNILLSPHFRQFEVKNAISSRLTFKSTLSEKNNNNFNIIHFLRKEFSYTKLKYSRTPSYDIISGGSALLFAGFLGFLTTEKFGFELVDSGDFLIMGIYFLLLIFSVRLIWYILNKEDISLRLLIQPFLFYFIAVWHWFV